ncbi:hypothetical protein CAOG_008865 [Capsaspora owczarzaki ATCC 30864]|uniref:Uncharacterized protein n=1 Tax=Capsaspora owczarzaki (strain ATCC 30864) TaxID=595528 RepID=A0A0D2WRK5_CAPO3|nr:hypothetical protein CAOG_008865 [Capsaspora owczarzaki ATCC 30864]
MVGRTLVAASSILRSLTTLHAAMRSSSAGRSSLAGHAAAEIQLYSRASDLGTTIPLARSTLAIHGASACSLSSTVPARQASSVVAFARKQSRASPSASSSQAEAAARRDWSQASSNPPQVTMRRAYGSHAHQHATGSSGGAGLAYSDEDALAQESSSLNLPPRDSHQRTRAGSRHASWSSLVDPMHADRHESTLDLDRNSTHATFNSLNPHSRPDMLFRQIWNELLVIEQQEQQKLQQQEQQQQDQDTESLKTETKTNNVSTNRVPFLPGIVSLATVVAFAQDSGGHGSDLSELAKIIAKRQADHMSKLQAVRDQLCHDLPRIFTHGLAFEMYTADVLFRDDIMGLQVDGLTSLKILYKASKSVAHILFYDLELDIIKATINLAEGTPLLDAMATFHVNDRGLVHFVEISQVTRSDDDEKELCPPYVLPGCA